MLSNATAAAADPPARTTTATSANGERRNRDETHHHDRPRLVRAPTDQAAADSFSFAYSRAAA